MTARLSYQDRLKIAQQPIVMPKEIPAPVTGWNTRDALTAMAQTDAVLLDNWYPDTGGVNLRNGYQSWATGLGSSPVRTLANYDHATVSRFIAASGPSIFDVTNTGAVGAPLATGFVSDQWQFCNFNGHLFLANGTDIMQDFNGVTIGNATFTGVGLNTIVGIWQYQQRLFMWQKNSSGFWFAPLNSISGPLNFVDLAPYCPKGGNLIAVTTFSHDGGNGVLDFIAFIMSSGDCLMFYGNDPSLSTNFSMIARYVISPPVNIRAVCNYGADSFLTTGDDHVPLQQELVALKLGQQPPRSKISSAVQAAVNANPNGFGWQSLFYPQGRRLIFNIPNADGTFFQHVYNTATNAWCRFKGMNAYTWGLFQKKLFFGGAGGKVWQADIGNLDHLGPISGDGIQAWSNLGSPLRKRVTAVRPIVQSTGNVGFSLNTGFDYEDISSATITVAPASGSPWDTSPWDTSPWSPESQISTSWHIDGGSGEAVSVRMTVAATVPVSWLRTDMRLEPGDAL